MRITIKECSEITGMSPQLIRIGMQKGLFPFGAAVKTSSRFTYVIIREKVLAWMERREQ